MAANKLYTIIEHTADIGIRVKGRDMRELFRKSAQAVFSIMAHQEKVKVSGRRSFEIGLKAANAEELLVSWLNELLSLAAAKQVIFTDFRLHELTERKLNAQAIGESAENYRMKTEVKAATYHDLKIKKLPGRGWEAEVILDV